MYHYISKKLFKNLYSKAEYNLRIAFFLIFYLIAPNKSFSFLISLFKRK